MADNWYVILELGFDPPVEDEVKIAERIDEKAKFWSTHFNDFKMGAQYRAWHQNIPQIKKDMIGSANIRTQLANDACTAVYDPIDERLKMMGRKGNISEDEGNRLAKRFKVSIEVIEKRAKHLGIDWVKGGNANHQKIYDKFYKTKPQNAAVYDNLGQMLSVFGVDNLYDFLFRGTTITFKSRKDTPYGDLLDKAKKLREKEFFKTDNLSGTGSKLCGQCELAFKNEESKNIYDSYLEYVKRKRVLDELKDTAADLGSGLSPEIVDGFIGKLTSILGNRSLAEEIFTAFCTIEKIAYNKGEDNSKNIKVCRCGCMNDVSDGRKVCSNCGLELTIRCPICGVENDANIKVCKCGFKFENIDKAIALCEQAEYAIEALGFKVADAHLSDADRYWPKSQKVSDLRARLTEYEKRVGAEVGKMHDAIKSKCYVEARKQYTDIKKLLVGYSDLAIEQEITKAISDAQTVYKQAQSAKAEKDVLELCAKAYDLCADLPGVRELMAKYPPAPATGFSVSVNPNTRGNIISWKANPADKSLRYVVVRSSNGWVQHKADGKEIFKGSASSYCDKDIEPGVAYYYNVFTERAGIVSEGAIGDFKEAVNLFEVPTVSVAAGDASLNLMWGALPHNATAEVYQIPMGGTEKHIASSLSDGYLVSGLTNDTQYRFRIVLSYIINGKKMETKGTSVVATPTCPPLPIDTLRVKPGQDDIFEATWYHSGPGDIRLFCSTEKPKYNVGDIVSVSALEREMRPLQQRPLSNSSAQKLKKDERGVSFQYSGSELLYIVAVVVKSGSAVFGSLARASKGESVNIKDIRPVNGKINIYLDAPRGAAGFVVLHRFDQFPVDISDTKTIRKYIPYKQYQLNSAIVLDTLEEKKYYFSVFAEFKRDGEKDYSSGSDYLFDNSAKVNITYSISVAKKFFGDGAVTLEFEADTGSFILPEIDVMSAVGNTPMFKSSAKLFHSIPSQNVDGSLSVKIPLPKGMPKDTYIKAFFKDEAAQAGNQLRLKIKSNYKVT